MIIQKSLKPSGLIGYICYTTNNNTFTSKDYKMLTRRLEALSYNDVLLYEGALLYVQGGRKDVNL